MKQKIRDIAKIASGVIALFIMSVGVSAESIDTWIKVKELIVKMLITPNIVLPFVYALVMMFTNNSIGEAVVTKISQAQVKATKFLNK